MSNDYYNHGGYPATRSAGTSSLARAEFAALAAAFDKLPTMSGNGLKLVRVNAGGTALESTSSLDGIAIGSTTPAAGAFTTLSATGNVTLGDAAGDTLTINGTAVAIPNGLNFDSGTLAIDSSTNRVGVGTASPSHRLHVTNTSDSGAVIRVANTGTGATSLTQTNGGLWLTAQAMNTTSKYTPAVMFGSTDTDFTTTNPKFGAVIVGEAADTYSVDTNGGMSLAFFTQPTAPGAAGNLIERMHIAAGGNVRIGGAGAAAEGSLHVIEGTSGGAAPNAAANTLVLDSAGSTGMTIRSPATASGFILFGDEASSVVGGVQYDHTTDVLYLRAGADTDMVGVAAGSVYMNGFNQSLAVVLGVRDTGSSGATPSTAADGIVLDASVATGISILTPNNVTATLRFGDPDNASAGQVQYNHSAGQINLVAEGTTRMSIASAEVTLASGVELTLADVTPTTSLSAGFRAIPTLSNTATATKAGVGKCYLNTAAITINNSVFAAGDVVGVYNNSASSFSITQGTITTMRLGGTTTTGSRTLAARGYATLFFPTATECVVFGAGVS